MKICFLLVLVAAGALGDRLTVPEILLQWKSNIDPYVDECRQETQVDLEHVHNFYVRGNLVENSNMKCNLKCYCEKLNLLKPNGSMDVQRWSKLFVGVTPEIAHQCAHSAATDPCERVYDMVSCAANAVLSKFQDTSI